MLKSQDLFLLTLSDPVPLTMHGEGNYALTDIKEIQVTEEFLSLDSEITECQSGMYKSDCEAGEYLRQISDTCHCAPLNLKNFYTEEVRWVVVVVMLEMLLVVIVMVVMVVSMVVVMVVMLVSLSTANNLSPADSALCPRGPGLCLPPGALLLSGEVPRPHPQPDEDLRCTSGQGTIQGNI